eukprot:jgi/Tetstr1/426353/TSEL_016665.t1
MAFTSTVAARPATLAVRASVRAARPQRVAAPKRALLARASGKEFLSSEGAKLQEALSAALKEAEECQDECAPAWDVVEELSAEMAHKISKVKADPLEEFCEDNPDADECRVYED